jgi:carbon storage regulator CsrA
VTIRVVAVQGNKVRLGIEAPPGINILREELLSQSGITEDAYFVREIREEPTTGVFHGRSLSPGRR